MDMDYLCKPLQVGIFGGGFDPVHYAHLNLAKTLITSDKLDRLIWVPTGIAWHKSHFLSDAKHRLKMLEIAFEQTAADISSKWEVSTCEIDRQGNSYTIETVDFLQKNYATTERIEWYLVIGLDQFNKIHTWENWSELRRKVKFLVFNRLHIDFKVESSVLNDANWSSMEVNPSELSSSGIRNLVNDLLKAKPKASPQFLIDKLSEFVPLGVAQYIMQQGLYVNEEKQDF